MTKFAFDPQGAFWSKPYPTPICNNPRSGIHSNMFRQSIPSLEHQNYHSIQTLSLLPMFPPILASKWVKDTYQARCRSRASRNPPLMVHAQQLESSSRADYSALSLLLLFFFKWVKSAKCTNSPLIYLGTMGTCQHRSLTFLSLKFCPNT